MCRRLRSTEPETQAARHSVNDTCNNAPRSFPTLKSAQNHAAWVLPWKVLQARRVVSVDITTHRRTQFLLRIFLHIYVIKMRQMTISCNHFCQYNSSESKAVQQAPENNQLLLFVHTDEITIESSTDESIQRKSRLENAHFR